MADTPETPEAPETPETPETPPAEEVQDPAAVLEANRKLNSENKTLRARAKKAEEAADAARQASLSEAEKALEDAKKAGFDQAEQFYKPLLASQKVVARAAGDFFNPTDVLAFIDLTNLDVDDDHAIDLALTKLAEDRPYLVAKSAPRPGIDQGPRGGGLTKPPGDSGSDWVRKAAGR